MNKLMKIRVGKVNRKKLRVKKLYSSGGWCLQCGAAAERSTRPRQRGGGFAAALLGHDGEAAGGKKGR